MTSEKDTILSFIGNMYGQVKEIDNHIAAAGSNAKFGGRSVELQNKFEEMVKSPAIGFEQPSPPLIQQPAVNLIESAGGEAIPQQFREPAAQQVVQNRPDPFQMELPLMDTQKNVLTDIYNVLFDMKKMLAEFIKSQKDVPAIVEEKKKYVNCCLCGSQPKYFKDEEKQHNLQCRQCKSKETAASKFLVESTWNSKNKQA